MPVDISHPDYWTEALQFTPTVHRDVYASLRTSNERIRAIAKDKVVLITGAGSGFGKVCMLRRTLWDSLANQPTRGCKFSMGESRSTCSSVGRTRAVTDRRSCVFLAHGNPQPTSFGNCSRCIVREPGLPRLRNGHRSIWRHRCAGSLCRSAWADRQPRRGRG